MWLIEYVTNTDDLKDLKVTSASLSHNNTIQYNKSRIAQSWAYIKTDRLCLTKFQ